MMSEAEIENALRNWRAAARVLRDEEGDVDWSVGLADGYVGALELVLYG